tara:strand:+ start:426 stop:644 length:219 start_codon:yes stop_codon:yes gene_type:complete
MTTTKSKVLKKLVDGKFKGDNKVEDKALISAIMSMDGWQTQARGTHDAEYEIYLSQLDDDDFKLTYDEWLGN